MILEKITKLMPSDKPSSNPPAKVPMIFPMPPKTTTTKPFNSQGKPVVGVKENVIPIKVPPRAAVAAPIAAVIA